MFTGLLQCLQKVTESSTVCLTYSYITEFLLKKKVNDIVGKHAVTTSSNKGLELIYEIR